MSPNDSDRFSPSDRVRAYPASADAERAAPAVSEGTELAERYWDRLRLFALRRLGDPADAEDVAQETLRRVLQALDEGRLRNPTALPAFVFQTARNICLQRGRKSQRESRALARLRRGSSAVSQETDPLTSLVTVERQEKVRRALDQLDEPDRDLLKRLFYDGMDTAEVARQLAITAGAVRVRKHRALQRVSALLGGPEA